jgi:hypothetical protein
MFNARHFCEVLCNRFSNLRQLSFLIVDGKNQSTTFLINLIHYLVDRLQQLVSLDIAFHDRFSSETPCFPHLV